MFDLSTDHDPITPDACRLLAEIGADPAAVRETLAEDFIRRCPDREVLADGGSADGPSPDAFPEIRRWRDAGDR